MTFFKVIWLWKVSNKFIHIYSNIVPSFLLPPSPPTPPPVQFMLRKMYVLFSSCGEILIPISLPSYFRPKPTVSCEEKRKDCRYARIQKTLGENGQGCSVVPVFPHPPLPPLEGGKVRFRTKSVGRVKYLIKEKNTSDVTKMHISWLWRGISCLWPWRRILG